MTTRYAQHVFTTAHAEVTEHGCLTLPTFVALVNLGYSIEAIAALERDFQPQKPLTWRTAA
jgi:hypothetical protein